MKRVVISILFAAFAAFSCAAHALPTVDEVQAEVQKGNFAQAQSMMREVVDARPKSAKAHYIYAEILARNGKFDDASREAAQARQLDPAIKFTQPERFRAFEQSVDRARQRADATSPSVSPPVPGGTTTLSNLGPSTSPMATTPALAPVQAPPLNEARSSGLPGWVLPVGLIALLFVGWRMMRSRTSGGAVGAAAPGSFGSSYGTPMGVPPNVGPMGGMTPSAGGGLLGTGLAAAGGVAAGMLVEKFLDRGREDRRDDNLFDRNASPGYSPAPDRDAQELENRNVDFGNGQDWGGDDASGGGSLDVGGGGGGSDDGGWS